MIPELTEIKNFKDYFISKDGRIFSKKRYNKLTEMILKVDKDGYLEVGLYKDNKRYFRRVHRLVAETFIENINNYPQINHKDGNIKNNSVENLEWVTCQQNIEHSYQVLKRKQLPTTNKKIKALNKKTNETLFFNSIIDFAKYLKMSHEHLERVLSGKNDINKCKKLKIFEVTFL